MSYSCDADLHSLINSTAGLCDSGMIFCKDGSMWCSPDHPYALTLSADEVKRIGRELTNKDFSGDRVQVNGVVYLPEPGEWGDVLVVQHQGTDWVYMKSTNCAVVVAHSTSRDKCDQNKIAGAVNEIATSLKKLGL